MDATNEAYKRNEALNLTLSAIINRATVSAKQLANTLGEIGVTNSLKDIISFFTGLMEKIRGILDGDGVGARFAKGLVKGISAIVSGPGLAIFGAIVAKLLVDFTKFGLTSLKTFFGMNSAAKEQAQLQGQIASTLLNNSAIQKQILNIEQMALSVEEKRRLQAKFFTDALNTQLGVMRQMQGIATTIAPAVMTGTRAARSGKAAGGFLPVAAEKSDISKGVGGAPQSAKPVVIPNFSFGSGQKGTMVANSSEYIVPNFRGSGGDAIFNQEMVKSMGLPSGAKKINAAGGFVPNFAKVADLSLLFPRSVGSKLNDSKKLDGRLSPDDTVNLTGNIFNKKMVKVLPNENEKQYEARILQKFGYISSQNLAFKSNSAIDGYKNKNTYIEIKKGGFIDPDVKLKFLRAPIENYGEKNILDQWTAERDNLSVKGLLVFGDNEKKEGISPKSRLQEDLIETDIHRAHKYGTEPILPPSRERLKSRLNNYIPNYAQTIDQRFASANNPAKLGRLFADVRGTEHEQQFAQRFPDDYERRISALGTGMYASHNEKAIKRISESERLETLPLVNAARKFALVAGVQDISLKEQFLYASNKGNIAKTGGENSQYRIAVPYTGVRLRELTSDYLKKFEQEALEKRIASVENLKGRRLSPAERETYLKRENVGAKEASIGSDIETQLGELADIPLQPKGQLIDFPVTPKLKKYVGELPKSARAVEIKASLSDGNLLSMGKKLLASEPKPSSAPPKKELTKGLGASLSRSLSNQISG
jgi:hypothetical protein